MKLKRLMGLMAGTLLLSLSMSCSDSPSAARSCTFDADCDLGAVCQLTSNTCIVVPCKDELGNAICLPDQICLVTAANPAGTCSAPECSSAADCVDKGGNCVGGACTSAQCNTAADCPSGQSCNLANQCVQGDGSCTGDTDCPANQVCADDLCVPGCRSNDDCQATQFCSTAKACVTGCRDASSCGTGQDCSEGRCVCTPGSCGEGKTCNTGSGLCEEVTACAQVTCPGTQVCNPLTLGCQDACTPEGCNLGEVCNTATGICEVSNCPGRDPAECATNPQRPLFDPVKCFCAECLTNADCNTAAGETCNASGICFSCQQACDPGTPGACGGNTPYCIDDCCVECIGVADCAQGEICLQGTCGIPPSCAVDPTVCPAGTSCQNGQCTANQSGGACDPTNPTSCPDGTFCDPLTMTCGGVGGGFGCGLCNADCTCDGGLTCDGFFCGGCCAVKVAGICVTPGVACPGSGTCIPGELLGLPNFCI